MGSLFLSLSDRGNVLYLYVSVGKSCIYLALEWPDEPLIAVQKTGFQQV